MYSYKCGHCGKTLIISERDIRPLSETDKLLCAQMSFTVMVKVKCPACKREAFVDKVRHLEEVPIPSPATPPLPTPSPPRESPVLQPQLAPRPEMAAPLAPPPLPTAATSPTYPMLRRQLRRIRLRQAVRRVCDVTGTGRLLSAFIGGAAAFMLTLLAAASLQLEPAAVFSWAAAVSLVVFVPTAILCLGPSDAELAERRMALEGTLPAAEQAWLAERERLREERAQRLAERRQRHVDKKGTGGATLEAPTIAIGMDEGTVEGLLGRPKTRLAAGSVAAQLARDAPQVLQALQAMGNVAEMEFAVYEHAVGPYQLVFYQGRVVQVFGQPSPNSASAPAPQTG